VQFAGACGGPELDMTPFSEHLAALIPPYRAVAPLTMPLLPGAIVVVDVAGGRSAVAQALRMRGVAPWCPLMALLPEAAPADPSTIQALLTAGNVSTVVRAGAVARLSATTVVEAIDTRPRPTVSELGCYVTSRLHDRAVGDWVEKCFDRGAESVATRSPIRLSDDTLRRRIRSFGALLPHDWSRVPKVVHALAYARAHRALPVIRIANDCGMDVRTLRSRVRYLAGIGLSRAIELAGWEWFMETVLRQWNYVPDNPPPPRTGVRCSTVNALAR
jgi:hypothetical protein